MRRGWRAGVPSDALRGVTGGATAGGIDILRVFNGCMWCLYFGVLPMYRRRLKRGGNIGRFSKRDSYDNVDKVVKDNSPDIISNSWIPRASLKLHHPRIASPPLPSFSVTVMVVE